MSSTALITPFPAGSMPAMLINSGTTELPVLNPAILNPQNAPTNPGLATTPLFLVVPSGSILEKKVFSAQWAGTLKTTATSTATLKAYYVSNAIYVAGTAATLGNDTALGTSGAISQNTTTTPFIIKITDAIFDSGSAKLTGKIEFQVNGTIVAAAEFSTIVTSVNSALDPTCAFLITLTPSAGIMTLIVTDASINL